MPYYTHASEKQFKSFNATASQTAAALARHPDNELFVEWSSFKDPGSDYSRLVVGRHVVSNPTPEGLDTQAFFSSAHEQFRTLIASRSRGEYFKSGGYAFNLPYTMLNRRGRAKMSWAHFRGWDGSSSEICVVLPTEICLLANDDETITTYGRSDDRRMRPYLVMFPDGSRLVARRDEIKLLSWDDLNKRSFVVAAVLSHVAGY
jgi:hypothetical protein